MAHVADTITVDRPVRTVYDQWTQFEEFPQFMGGVEEVRQLDDAHLHWIASIAGVTREWEATIEEQQPDRVIRWASTGGAQNDGTVSFRPIEPGRTEVKLELDFDPEGVVEQTGDKLGFVSRQVKSDLERFKEFIESRTLPTGEWRGEIRNERVVRDDTGR